MSGGSVALDTNRAIAVLNGAPGVAQWLAGFSDVFLPAAVIGELKYGALNSQRAKENLDRVERLIASCGFFLSPVQLRPSTRNSGSN